MQTFPDKLIRLLIQTMTVIHLKSSRNFRELTSQNLRNKTKDLVSMFHQTMKKILLKISDIFYYCCLKIVLKFQYTPLYFHHKFYFFLSSATFTNGKGPLENHHLLYYGIMFKVK